MNKYIFIFFPQWKTLIFQNLERNQGVLRLFMAWCLSSGADCQLCTLHVWGTGIAKMPETGGSFLPSSQHSISPKAKESVSPRSPDTSQKGCWEDRHTNWQALLSWKPAWIPLEIGQKWKFSCGTFWFQWMAYPDEKMFHQKFSSQIVRCWK